MEHMVICIGRQYGSGGREIGECLAQKLGVSCYDKLLIPRQNGASRKAMTCSFPAAGLALKNVRI